MGVVLKKKSSKHGIKVKHHKLSKDIPIETARIPEKVVIPLQQHIGAPCKVTVKRGEKVKVGDKIGESDAFVSAPIHATVSGEIKGMTKVINPPTGMPVDAVIIESDGKDKWGKFEGVDNIEDISAEDIVKMIRNAGIVGLGGATFPTHVKLSPPKDKVIDTVILNGCECEPYITSDHRVMLEYGREVLLGLSVISKILSPENVYIAIEDNKMDAIEKMEDLILEMGFEKEFRIVPLCSKYPMGGEKTLIKTVLNREVPIGGLPLDVGVVVQNVATAKAIHDAVFYGKPLVERVVTVTGDIKSPKNLLTRFGTPIKSLIEYANGYEIDDMEVILGGPMMGISQFDMNFPVTKGTNSILVKRARRVNEGECIRCGRCVNTCPMNLLPTMFVKYVKRGMYEMCKEIFVDDCMECGSCAYMCPANIPIVQYIKIAKSELRKRR